MEHKIRNNRLKFVRIISVKKNCLIFELADKLIKKIYKKTLNFPQKYQFSIGEQLRRASLSVILNIVEGGARKSNKEKKQFINISFGSLKETKYLLYFSKELLLIDEDEFDEFILKINELAKILYGLLYKNKK